jgi:hypothetical protein
MQGLLLLCYRWKSENELQRVHVFSTADMHWREAGLHTGTHVPAAAMLSHCVLSLLLQPVLVATPTARCLDYIAGAQLLLRWSHCMVADIRLHLLPVIHAAAARAGSQYVCPAMFAGAAVRFTPVGSPPPTTPHAREHLWDMGYSGCSRQSYKLPSPMWDL